MGGRRAKSGVILDDHNLPSVIQVILEFALSSDDDFSVALIDKLRKHVERKRRDRAVALDRRRSSIEDQISTVLPVRKRQRRPSGRGTNHSTETLVV